MSGPSKLLKRFPKRASVAGNPGVEASSETVSQSGTTTVERDSGAEHLRVQMCGPLLKLEYRDAARRIVIEQRAQAKR